MYSLKILVRVWEIGSVVSVCVSVCLCACVCVCVSVKLGLSTAASLPPSGQTILQSPPSPLVSLPDVSKDSSAGVKVCKFLANPSLNHPTQPSGSCPASPHGYRSPAARLPIQHPPHS